MAQSITEKEQKLRDLFLEKEKIQKQIDSLLYPEKVAILPPDFSISEQVLNAIIAHPEGIHAQSIVTVLQNKFPSYGIDRKKVNGALQYLKSDLKKIEGLGKGLYKARIENEKTTT